MYGERPTPFGWGICTFSGALGASASVLVAAMLFAPPAPAHHFACPRGMKEVLSKFCIDPFEESTWEVGNDRGAHPHSPYTAVADVRVRAVSERGVVPQAYINRNESEAACSEAGKRLCTNDEWVLACKGEQRTRYPYGDSRRAHACVDTNRVSPLAQIFGAPRKEIYRFAPMNDPRLNQVPGTLAPTGSFTACTNSYGVYDMVGNLHEWIADPAGTFRGGYYLDTTINGEGCDYKTVAHAGTYHDYSTGFRCCWSPEMPHH